MTVAHDRVLKFFLLVCVTDLNHTPITFDVIRQWATDSQFYKHQYFIAIKCAISEVESVLDTERKYNNFGEVALLTDELTELKAML